jgi:hypothetical protein
VTISAFAATRLPETGGRSAYQPGTCNIGPQEIAQRRRAGHMGLLASIAWLVGLIVLDAPAPLRLTLAIPVAAAAIGYLQAWLRFCAGFGARGVFNFDAVGSVQEVTDPDALARDRRRALRIALASLAIGAVAGVAAFVGLP